MERHRLLIVIDNAESLLTGTGQWRDGRWGQVAGVLTAHTGLGRVIITSRRVPTGTSPVLVELVDTSRGLASYLTAALLIARFFSDPETAERTLQDLISQAQALASQGEQAGAGESGCSAGSTRGTVPPWTFGFGAATGRPHGLPVRST